MLAAVVRQGGYVMDLEIDRIDLRPGFGLQHVVGELERAAADGDMQQQQSRHSPGVWLFLRRLRLQGADQPQEIQVSVRIKIGVDHRPFDADLAERPCPAQQAAGFEIHEQAPGLQHGQSAVFGNGQVIDLDAEQEWIDVHVPDRRPGAQMLLDQLRQLLPDQPGRGDETGQRIKQQ